MMDGRPIRILGVAGSLREASYNRRLVRLAAAATPDGAELIEATGLADVEPFNADLEESGFPPGVAHFARQVLDSDAVFFATPEYNGSVPGQLKNALDWLSRADGGPTVGSLRDSAFYGRPVAVVSASDGQFGATWARDELMKVLKTQGARVLAEPKLALAAANVAFADDGTLLSADAGGRLSGLVAALVDQVRALRTAREAAGAT